MPALTSSLRRSLTHRGATLRALDPRVIQCHSKTFASKTPGNRSEGSIGDAFASLSNNEIELPARFAELKRGLIGQNGDAILDSWMRLLKHLEKETIPQVNELSHSIIPEVDFSSIVENGGELPEKAKGLLKDRGTIIIRGLVPEKQALDWKQSVRDYIKKNPSTKGFPAHDIQVYELYWSKAQLEARAHQNMLRAQTALNLVWNKKPEDRVVLREPTTYCDRLRMRTVSTRVQFGRNHLTTSLQPGDKSFNLGPHLDGGSLERWEDAEYRKCYTEILQGRWEDHDAFNISPRLGANVDMYNGPGGCSAFRSYQVSRTSKDQNVPTVANSRTGMAFIVRMRSIERLPSGIPRPQGFYSLHSSAAFRIPNPWRLDPREKLVLLSRSRHGCGTRAPAQFPPSHQSDWLHNNPHDAAGRRGVLALRRSTHGREGTSGQARCQCLLHPCCTALRYQRRLSQAPAGQLPGVETSA